MATKKQPKVVARPKARGKTRTPKQVAIQWGAKTPEEITRSSKTIRRKLREIYETTHEDWALTDAMVNRLAEHMGVDPKSGSKI